MPAPEAPVSIHFDPSYRLPPDRGEGRPATSPRYFIIACCFFATFAAYVERISFSIAYTSMARDAGMDEAVKGVVMASFFWGYAISQVPGGWAAQRYGGRIVLLLCFASWSTLSLLTPGSGSNTSGLTMARFMIGVSQGFLIPSVHTVLAMWVPPRDRVKATSMTTSGMYLGSACATLVLPSIELHLGAASLLRVVGVLGLCWMVCWYQTPPAPRSSQHDIPLRTETADDKHRTGRSTPWKRIVLHPAVWAIVTNNFTFHYAFYIVMNWMPTYFHSLLHKDLSSLGMLKAFPYIGMFVMSNAGGWMGDWLIHKYQFTIAGARKTVNTLGFVGSALALLAMPLARGALPGIVCTALCLAMLGLSRGGFSVNHMDIAPKYAGAVMGISNTAGTVAGVIGVSTTGWLLSRAGGPDSPSGWWNVFSHSALVCVAGMGIFTSFARGEQLFD